MRVASGDLDFTKVITVSSPNSHAFWLQEARDKKNASHHDNNQEEVAAVAADN